MNQKSLAKWLKTILIGCALCGLVVYFLLFPLLGQSIVHSQPPDYAKCFWPWLLFLWCTGVPCYGALLLGWKIAGNIGADRSFSLENSVLLRKISRLAAFDSLLVFVGNLVLLALHFSHPSAVLLSLFVVFAGLAIAVAAACLSHLVHRAAELQEQSDLTI